jgi:hypothetical protein
LDFVAVFGKDATSYIIPNQETDGGQNMLIKVSSDGKRAFTVTRNQLGDVSYSGTNFTESATRGGGCAPVVLKNPDDAGKETIFMATYTRAFAVDEDGELLWNTAIVAPSVQTAINSGNQSKVKEELAKRHRIFGINYHPIVDAYIIADTSGDIMAFDR